MISWNIRQFFQIKAVSRDKVSSEYVPPEMQEGNTDVDPGISYNILRVFQILLTYENSLLSEEFDEKYRLKLSLHSNILIFFHQISTI